MFHGAAGMQLYALIFIGAGLGGTLRYLVQQVAARLVGDALPYGTGIVNLAGCFLMGVVCTFLATRSDTATIWRPLLATGFLGGFTTFSAFSQEVVALYQRGFPTYAAAYAVLSVTLSLVFFLGGATLSRWW